MATVRRKRRLRQAASFLLSPLIQPPTGSYRMHWAQVHQPGQHYPAWSYQSRPNFLMKLVNLNISTKYAQLYATILPLHGKGLPPWMKLLAFYMLDGWQFALFAIPLFLEACKQVDQSTRKMEEMSLTWCTVSISDKELFGVVLPVTIERGIWGGDSGQADVRSHHWKSSIESHHNSVIMFV